MRRSKRNVVAVVLAFGCLYISIASVATGRATTLLGVGGAVCAVLCSVVALRLRLRRTSLAIASEAAQSQRSEVQERGDGALEAFTGLGCLLGLSAPTLEHGDLFLRQLGWSIAGFALVVGCLTLYRYGRARWLAERQGRWVA